ncbi:cytochrome b5 domain-containing protein [Inediibacterium massiliense]|uniref:cytochrome b5 domain-containing protein n=1 Tax=Inediibacterium massiliense TaxID=1658111 RepID=UPI0006B41FD6|nr:cytochrome b5 domain-containing protein [Inediibacterium massiliense]
MNNKNGYYSILSSIYRNIEYYKDMITFSNNPYQRMFYEIQLYNERMHLYYWQNYYYHYINNGENQLNQRTQPSQRNLPEERIFTVEDLAQYDGSNGKPAYVAVNGIVYDVSLEPTWGGGTHFGLYAGKDLTAQFNGCHNGRLEVLRNLSKVGVFKESS